VSGQDYHPDVYLVLGASGDPAPAPHLAQAHLGPAAVVDDDPLSVRGAGRETGRKTIAGDQGRKSTGSSQTIRVKPFAITSTLLFILAALLLDPILLIHPTLHSILHLQGYWYLTE
jgi:hypothetical protein